MLQPDTAYAHAPLSPGPPDARRGHDEGVAGMSDPMSPYRSVTAASYMDSSASGAPDRDDGRRLLQGARTLSGPVSPFSLPLQYFSPPAGGDLPRQDSSSSSSSANSQPPARPTPPDRSSTRSLPLPMHTPYHTLPTVQQAESGADPMAMAIDIALDQPSSSTTSSPVLSTRTSQARVDIGSDVEADLHLHDVSNSGSNIDPDALHPHLRSTATAPPQNVATNSAHGRPPPGTLRDNSVPHPHPQALSSPASSTALSASASTPLPASFSPAMTMTTTTYAAPGTPLASSQSATRLSVASASTASTASSSATTSTAALVRPPEPPTVTVLTPAAPLRAAHAPFLSQAPPPQDSYLAVETSPREYQLVARLPGFRRDAM